MKLMVSCPGFALALAGTGRLVVRIQAIEKDDLRLDEMRCDLLSSEYATHKIARAKFWP